MSAVPEDRWDGRPVQIVMNGEIVTATYRQAVSLVSRGRATWAPAPKKTPSKPQVARTAPKSTPTVSAPTKSAEGDQTGYEPSPSDP